MDDFSVDPRARAGDPSSAHAAKVRELAELEERYRHELMDEDECLELLERILRLRGKLGVSSA